MFSWIAAHTYRHECHKDALKFAAWPCGFFTAMLCTRFLDGHVSPMILWCLFVGVPVLFLDLYAMFITQVGRARSGKGHP